MTRGWSRHPAKGPTPASEGLRVRPHGGGTRLPTCLQWLRGQGPGYRTCTCSIGMWAGLPAALSTKEIPEEDLRCFPGVHRIRGQAGQGAEDRTAVMHDPQRDGIARPPSGTRPQDSQSVCLGPCSSPAEREFDWPGFGQLSILDHQLELVRMPM